MFGRGRSKDRTSRKVTPPSPSYMSNNQFANYLAELRDNRIARPGGARPLPATENSRSNVGQVPLKSQSLAAASLSSSTVDEVPARAESAQSHRRARSSMSISSKPGRALVRPPPTGPPPNPSIVIPSANYIVRGQRWMEKEEANSLRDALEDMDIKEEQDEEARLHAAAQEEASELVWKHQNPQKIIRPDAPYRYKSHLRKNSYQIARAQSAGPYTGHDSKLDSDPRSASRESDYSSRRLSQRDRVSMESSTGSGPGNQPQESRVSVDRNRVSVDGNRVSVEGSRGREHSPWKIQKSYGGLAHTISGSSSRRRSSRKRNISGEVGSPFTTDQIWEEPDTMNDNQIETQETGDVPPPLRLKPRNPINRVQFEQDIPVQIKPLSRFEIHKNPPSQSRNPTYTASTPLASADAKIPEVPTKDGLEIRSEDIRGATSMKLKDRSPKLPMPTVVSDRPGRPIVSFDANWKPSEADLKPVEEPRRPRVETKFEATRPKYTIGGPRETKSVPSEAHKSLRSTAQSVAQTPQAPPNIQVDSGMTSAPSINVSPADVPAILADIPALTIGDVSMISVSEIVVSEPPSISVSGPPTISDSEFPPTSISGPPSISVSGPPSISVSGPPSISVSGPPSISVSGPPAISVSAPPVPSIVGPSNSSRPQSTRPLPDPKSSARKNPFTRPNRQNVPAPIPRGHWSPAGTRATATCHSCQLPIEGRVIALAGLSERWHPHCFHCHTCGTPLADFEISPEPAAEREQRLGRIARRADGEFLEDIPGKTEIDDGDEGLRFYCHLDWHELFAPKCKHCRTPIIGEHVVALGEHFHYGHFFCAECGDPFEKGMSHIEKDGYAWCLGCQTQRTERRAPKCGLCKKPVIGNVVQALGKEFHEDCFRCGDCGGGFDDGQIFLREEMGVVCTACMERCLKA